MSLRTAQNEEKLEKKRIPVRSPGQVVKYPYCPLVRRAARSPARLLSLLLSPFLLTLVCHASHLVPAAPAVVRACTSLLSAPAPFKYQGELRLGRRAPPSEGSTGAQSRVRYQPSQWESFRNTPVNQTIQSGTVRAARGNRRLLLWHGFCCQRAVEFCT